MNREQRVRKVIKQASLTGWLIALITLGVSGLQELHLGDQNTQDFIQGVGYGIRTAFPLVFSAILYRAYQTMDEYGRQQMLKAAAFAFMVVMAFTMAYYPLHEAGKLPDLPIWVTWLLGMVAYCTSMGVQARR